MFLSQGWTDLPEDEREAWSQQVVYYVAFTNADLVQDCTLPIINADLVQDCTLPTTNADLVQDCSLPTTNADFMQYCTLPIMNAVLVQEQETKAEMVALRAYSKVVKEVAYNV